MRTRFFFRHYTGNKTACRNVSGKPFCLYVNTFRKAFLVAIMFLAIAEISEAQTDSLSVEAPSVHSFIHRQLLPLSLIATGSLLNIGSVKNHLEDLIPTTHTRVDNYLQYTPMVQLYVFDAFNHNHQNDFLTQTKYLAISQLASEFIVHSLKNTTHVSRPRVGHTSFPSGHTTNAFVGATVLYKEFKDSDPWIAYSGYVVATATGVLRLTNRAHWVPDVLVGAGLGILTVNAVYYLQPLKSLQFKHEKLSFAPCIGYKSVALTCTF